MYWCIFVKILTIFTTDLVCSAAFLKVEFLEWNLPLDNYGIIACTSLLLLALKELILSKQHGRILLHSYIMMLNFLFF